jgi:glycopeptide antibiotics resistance protein
MIRYLFWFYVLVIVLLVTLPINSVGELNDITIIQLRGDYFFHALLFIPWVFFMVSMRKPFMLWFILGLLLAISSELIQYYLPYRAFNINDLVANSIGIILGYTIYYSFHKLKNIKT